jgi:hypothetical protein
LSFFEVSKSSPNHYVARTLLEYVYSQHKPVLTKQTSYPTEQEGFWNSALPLMSSLLTLFKAGTSLEDAIFLWKIKLK